MESTRSLHHDQFIETAKTKVMPFGKHKGKLLIELPFGYIDFILTNTNLSTELFNILYAVHYAKKNIQR